MYIYIYIYIYGNSNSRSYYTTFPYCGIIVIDYYKPNRVLGFPSQAVPEPRPAATNLIIIIIVLLLLIIMIMIIVIMIIITIMIILVIQIIQLNKFPRQFRNPDPQLHPFYFCL